MVDQQQHLVGEGAGGEPSAHASVGSLAERTVVRRGGRQEEEGKNANRSNSEYRMV
jgi:hypothetical protein